MQKYCDLKNNHYFCIIFFISTANYQQSKCWQSDSHQK